MNVRQKHDNLFYNFPATCFSLKGHHQVEQKNLRAELTHYTKIVVMFKFNVLRPEVLEHINTTCQSITQHVILYTIKIVYCQGDMFRRLFRSSLGLQGKQIQELSIFKCIVRSQMLTDCVIWDPTVH